MLERDRDPRFNRRWLKKAEGQPALQAGVDLLTRDQDRLAAQELDAANAELEAERPGA